MGHDQAARAHAYRQWLNAGIAPARPRPILVSKLALALFIVVM
jgi:hypothetical protein